MTPVSPDLPVPTFTPPSVTLDSKPPFVGASPQAVVNVYDDPFRSYHMIDAEARIAAVRALESALHEEWMRLRRQQAICKRLTRLLKEHRANPTPTTP